MKEQNLKIFCYILILIIAVLLVIRAFDFGCYRSGISEVTGKWFVNTQSFMETETGVQCWTWADGESCQLLCIPLSAMPQLEEKE